MIRLALHPNARVSSYLGRIAGTSKGEEARERRARETAENGRGEKNRYPVDLRPRHRIVIRRSSYLHGEEAWSEFPRKLGLAYSARNAFLGALRENDRKTIVPRRSRKIIANE